MIGVGRTEQARGATRERERAQSTIAGSLRMAAYAERKNDGAASISFDDFRAQVRRALRSRLRASFVAHGSRLHELSLCKSTRERFTTSFACVAGTGEHEIARAKQIA
jgi:hypothetical protein